MLGEVKWFSIFVSVFFIFLWGAILSGSQGVLLILQSGITPGRLKDPDGVLGSNLGRFACRANTLLTILLLWSLHGSVYWGQKNHSC